MTRLSGGTWMVAFTLMVAVSILIAAPAPAHAGSVDAQTVFEHLKSLEGTWNGPREASAAGGRAEAESMPPTVHEFRISAAGTVVMETMAPGTDHEMINMYHLDGDELVLTHYCAGGNQPTMRLDREKSTGDHLVFDFTGGTNIDPSVDQHIHAARFTLVDDEHLESTWVHWTEGRAAGEMTAHLSRK